MAEKNIASEPINDRTDWIIENDVGGSPSGGFMGCGTKRAQVKIRDVEGRFIVSYLPGIACSVEYMPKDKDPKGRSETCVYSVKLAQVTEYELGNVVHMGLESQIGGEELKEQHMIHSHLSRALLCFCDKYGPILVNVSNFMLGSLDRRIARNEERLLGSYDNSPEKEKRIEKPKRKEFVVSQEIRNRIRLKLKARRDARNKENVAA